jgi:hypothetical protein
LDVDALRKLTDRINDFRIVRPKDDATGAAAPS